MPIEHGHVEPRLHPRRDFTAPVGGIDIEQGPPQVGPPFADHVVQGHGADDAAGAAGFRCFQAEQPDDIDAVRMEFEAAVGLIVPCGRVLDVPPDVAHMAQQMPLGVAGPETADVGPQPQIADGRFRDAVTIDRKPAQQHETAPVDDLVAQRLQARPQGRKMKGLGPDIRHAQVVGLMGADGRVDFGDLALGQMFDPDAGCRHVRAPPGAGAADRPGGQVRRCHVGRRIDGVFEGKVRHGPLPQVVGGNTIKFDQLFVYFVFLID